MAHHFLLSSKAKTLSLRSVFSVSEERAYTKFKRLRWISTKGSPVWPLLTFAASPAAQHHQSINNSRSRYYVANSPRPYSGQNAAHIINLAARHSVAAAFFISKGSISWRRSQPIIASRQRPNRKNHIQSRALPSCRPSYSMFPRFNQGRKGHGAMNRTSWHGSIRQPGCRA